MTRDEALETEDLDSIWKAMQNDDALHRDPVVWEHMMNVSAQRYKELCIEAFGYYAPDICIDPIPRSDLKK